MKKPHFFSVIGILGLLEQLNDMNVKLEEIQKSLDMYLETKRQIFPRFYFLSNDDLLEILGQSKNPEAVQPHLKKCFDNIVRLKMAKVIIIKIFFLFFQMATYCKSCDFFKLLIVMENSFNVCPVLYIYPQAVSFYVSGIFSH